MTGGREKHIMDCYFPLERPIDRAGARSAGKAICATCRDESGGCPSCRLAAKVEAATAAAAQIWRSSAAAADRKGSSCSQAAACTRPPPRSGRVARARLARLPALAAGAPIAPGSQAVARTRRQAFKAIGFNVGIFAFWGVFSLIAQVPSSGFSAWRARTAALPLFLIASVYFGIKAWNGEDVRIPVMSDWLDDRLPARAMRTRGSD